MMIVIQSYVDLILSIVISSYGMTDPIYAIFCEREWNLGYQTTKISTSFVDQHKFVDGINFVQL